MKRRRGSSVTKQQWRTHNSLNWFEKCAAAKSISFTAERQAANFFRTKDKLLTW
jgi:hypothetical protein